MSDNNPIDDLLDDLQAGLVTAVLDDRTVEVKGEIVDIEDLRRKAAEKDNAG